MKSEKNFHQKRQFLNDRKGMAATESWVTVFEGSIECGVAITDCCRRVELDFNHWDASNPKTNKTKKNNLKKIDRLIDMLTEVRESLHEAYEYADEYNAAWTKVEEKKAEGGKSD